MITAIDSSVLFCIFKGEPSAESWIELVIQHAARGRLVVCDIVVAEVGAYFESEKYLFEQLKNLSIDFVPSDFASSYLAGKIFSRYRAQGGKREVLIPDFLVGAHAMAQADALMAVDRGYLRRYFKDLKVISVS